ncbi:MAG TPA: response regulator, partial [Gemmataceae bacterium]
MFDTPAPKPGILVVDDEPFVLDVIEHLLRHHGFEVWPAGGGAEALALYQRHRDAVALVLLDVQMPGLDGPQTLRALRALNPDVRCCFMS